jgi:hypothetical protein
MAPAAAGGVDPRLIGMTIEYAIGLDLAHDAYASRRSLLPAAHAEWIAAQVDGSRMSHPRTSPAALEDPDFVDHAAALAEAMTDLDEWFRRGGFLPARWRPAEYGKLR